MSKWIISLVIGLLFFSIQTQGQIDQLCSSKNVKNMEDEKTMEETKEYLGTWVTEDGRIRHKLLPNGRYDEARGNKESAYEGYYWVHQNHIEYKDDTGFTADGDFKNGILYHGGMIFYKLDD